LSNRNQIKNNWLHDVNDAQVLDTDGYGGNGIYVDSTTGNIDVENNLVYRVTSHAYQNTLGPYSTSDPNYVNNNIFSYARVGMIYEGASSTGTPNALTTTISNNIFYFDGNGTRSSYRWIVPC
jgi:ankyrin repeat protein